MTNNNTVKQIGVGRHGIKTMPAFGMSDSVDFFAHRSVQGIAAAQIRVLYWVCKYEAFSSIIARGILQYEMYQVRRGN